MKIVVVGGSRLVGTELVNKLRKELHQVVAASPSCGVNTLSGEGLAESLKGASVIVDVSNSSTFEDATALKFLETSTRNLPTYEVDAGVGHHVAFPVVGLERPPEYGYFRAKIAQENLIEGSSISNSIIRATQFFEFIARIADQCAEGNTVRQASALIQPMGADDVASAVGRIAVGTPVNGAVEIAGPEQFRLDELVRQDVASLNDPREAASDLHALYFGGELSEPARQVPNTSLQPAVGTGRLEQFIANFKPMWALAFLITITLIMTGTLMAEETITPLMSNDLAGVSGKELLMYTVDFPAGFSSPVHRHNAQVSVYVLEGSVVMQVKGGKEVTLGPGQSFYESPSDIHIVSRNASSKKPAKVLVFLVKQKGTPLVVPAR